MSPLINDRAAKLAPDHRSFPSASTRLWVESGYIMRNRPRDLTFLLIRRLGMGMTSNV